MGKWADEADQHKAAFDSRVQAAIADALEEIVAQKAREIQEREWAAAEQADAVIKAANAEVKPKKE